MEAIINVTGKSVESNEILESVNDLQISFGINFDLMEEIEKGKKKSGTIAKGILPIEGKDGYIEMFIEKPSKKPILSEDGRVNFYELDMIKNVKKGEIIAVRHVPSKGKDGINIFSKKIAAKPGKFINFNLGKLSVLKGGFTHPLVSPCPRYVAKATPLFKSEMIVLPVPPFQVKTRSGL
jgi:uncharacterized protein (DUF342 family)